MADDEIPPECTFPAIDVEAAQRRAREQQERFLADSVMREEMTPAEADALAIRLGVTFDGQNWPAAMGDPYWPLVFAILWIAWRDPERVAQQWDRFRVWAGRIWRDPQHQDQLESLQDAEVNIWKALESGKVRAVGIPFIESDVMDIPAVQWRNLQWMPDQKLISVRNFAQVDARYRCVDVESSRVLALWPVLGTLAPEAAEETKQPEDVQPRKRDKGGALPQYDEIDFLIEAFRIVYDGSCVLTSQADLNRRATDAYAAMKGLPAGKPSLEWGRENIRRLWVGLGIERPKRSQ